MMVFYFKSINQTRMQTLTHEIGTYYVYLVVIGFKRIQRKKSLHNLKEGNIVPLTIHASNYGLYNYSM